MSAVSVNGLVDPFITAVVNKGNGLGNFIQKHFLETLFLNPCFITELVLFCFLRILFQGRPTLSMNRLVLFLTTIKVQEC